MTKRAGGAARWKRAAFTTTLTRQVIRGRFIAGETIHEIADDMELPRRFVKALVLHDEWNEFAPIYGGDKARRTAYRLLCEARKAHARKS